MFGIATLVAAVALARPERARAPREPSIPRREQRSVSVGWPWRGQLLRPNKVEPSDYIRYVDEYAPRGNFYGTWELAQLVQRAAFRVAARLPGAKLSIGELSAVNGGDIDDHGSHENGRDIDISYYMTTADGEPYNLAQSFVQFNADGTGQPPNDMLRFDDARNWELVARLISDSDARVQYIFMANTLRDRVIREARRRHAPAGLIERAEQLLVQPGPYRHPHRNHMHVRIYCPPGDRPRCKDRSPFWPWYPGVLPAVGPAASPVVASND